MLVSPGNSALVVGHMIAEPLLEEECVQHEWGESYLTGRSTQAAHDAVVAHI